MPADSTYCTGDPNLSVSLGSVGTEGPERWRDMPRMQRGETPEVAFHEVGHSLSELSAHEQYLWPSSNLNLLGALKTQREHLRINDNINRDQRTDHVNNRKETATPTIYYTFLGFWEL